MRTGTKLLGASGASFVRFNEWKSYPETLTMGDVPSSKDGDWQNRLTHTATRQACRQCSLRESGAECVLGEDINNPFFNVYCLPIVSNEREYGLVNFFFQDQVAVSANNKKYLRLLSEHAGLALENLRHLELGTDALAHLDSSRANRAPRPLLASLSSELRNELNFSSVLFWSPDDSEIFIAALLSNASDDSDKQVLNRNDGFALELWQTVEKNKKPFTRELVDEEKRKVGILIIPIAGTTNNPIGMLVCVYDSVDRDFSSLMPILKLIGQNVYLVIQSALLADQKEYSAARDERLRLAREIHDGLAQTIAYLKIQTSQMLNYFITGKMENLESSLTSSYQTLSAAYQDARREIDDLRFVAEADTQEWLISLATGFRDDTGIDVDVSGLQINAKLPLAVQSQLIRIVQEALNNVRQHSRAEKVSVSGYIQAGEVVLEISDDGRGFEPEMVDTGSRYGLVGMRERTDLVGGEFQIISMQDRGTTIRVSIPLASPTWLTTPKDGGE
jgi:two-component system nitrate/nitrite sensor histidine kinase NarX